MTSKQTIAGRKLILLMLASLPILSANSQDSLTTKLAYIAIDMTRPPVKVGQLMPDSNIGKVFNFQSLATKFSDFKGKLVILDFWHQWCITCLEEFPKLEALQKEFGNQILILPVTFQSEKSVREFITKRKQAGKPMGLPSIIEDTLLRKMFPHNGDPHEVWIDPDGMVRSITEAQAVTKENIAQVLKGSPVELEQKNYSFDFNPFAPLLINGNGGPDSLFRYRSMIAPYIDSISSGGFQRQKTKERTRLFIANTPILDLYLNAYKSKTADLIPQLDMDYKYKRVLYETNDSSKFIYWDKIDKLDYKSFIDTRRTHLFCYELIFPGDISIEEASTMMIEDLDRFFQVRSGIEKRSITHLNLSVKPGPDKIRTIGKKQEEFISPDSLHIRISNRPLSDLISIFNVRYELPLMVDKTYYTNFVDIQLNFDSIPSVNSLRKELQKYGLIITQENDPIDMLILRDLNNQNKPAQSFKR